MKTKFKPTIGFETHVELATHSKMFCGCPADHFSKKPNTQTCPVCLGLPGALPVPNKQAIEWTMMIGLALNCKIAAVSKFDRKHYFYPDLPKGYQISQYDEPLCFNGYLETSEGRVNITRVHLEEDTGKLQHTTLDGQKVSLVDFNRSGVPLVEIVTEPDIHSSSQAKEFAQKLRDIVRHLGVSDCDMEKGSMRLEANISLGLDLGYKVEVKNVNSFRFIAKAIDFELDRQQKLLDAGQTPSQETRGWNEKTNSTKTQRVKETAADYRYFPEPDIPPLELDPIFVESIRQRIPQLPEAISQTLQLEWGIRATYADLISQDKNTTLYVLEAIKLAKTEKISADALAGHVVNKKVDITKLLPDQLIKTLTTKSNGASNDEIETWVNAAIQALPQAVLDFKAGKAAAIGVLIGKIMGLSKGKADPTAVKKLLEAKLSS